jgi:hypothetical protein
VLFAENLTFSELTRRFAAGARLIELPSQPSSASQRVDKGLTPLFVTTSDGRLRVVTAGAQIGSAPRRSGDLPRGPSCGSLGDLG